MKFNIFRATDDRTGGRADPTEAPRMGGQVLPEIGLGDVEDIAVESFRFKPMERFGAGSDRGAGTALEDLSHSQPD